MFLVFSDRDESESDFEKRRKKIIENFQVEFPGIVEVSEPWTVTDGDRMIRLKGGVISLERKITEEEQDKIDKWAQWQLDLYGWPGANSPENNTGILYPLCPLDRRLERWAARKPGLMKHRAKISLMRQISAFASLQINTIEELFGPSNEALNEETYLILSMALEVPPNVLRDEYVTWRKIYDYLLQPKRLDQALENSRVGKAFSAYDANISVRKEGKNFLLEMAVSKRRTNSAEAAERLASVFEWRSIEPFRPE